MTEPIDIHQHVNGICAALGIQQDHVTRIEITATEVSITGNPKPQPPNWPFPNVTVIPTKVFQVTT